MGNKKLIRITTIPESLMTLLKGQLHFMSDYFEVIAVSSDGKCFNDMLKQEGVKGYRVQMTRKITPFADLKALCLLIKLFVKEKPDIVHTHTPKAGILGMLAAWITHVPFRLHTVAGLPLLVATGPKRKLLDFVERVTYACATKVYPNSITLRDIIVQNKYTNPTKLKVIANGSSNGIDISFFSVNSVSVSRDTIRRNLNLQEKDFVFVFVGRIVKDKGMNELAFAMKRLSSQYAYVKLILVGPYESDLNPILPGSETFFRNSSSVLQVGVQKDVRPYLLAADVLVFPSYREGFPNVVMQAGAMGLPSIVTNINGCNEIIIEGKNGVIIPPKDADALYVAMKNFVENPDQVKALASNARQMIASRYEQKMVWKLLLKEYQTLCTNIYSND